MNWDEVDEYCEGCHMTDVVRVLEEAGSDALYKFANEFLLANELGLGFLYHDFIRDDWEKKEAIVAMYSERNLIRLEEMEQE